VTDIKQITNDAMDEIFNEEKAHGLVGMIPECGISRMSCLSARKRTVLRLTKTVALEVKKIRIDRGRTMSRISYNRQQRSRHEAKATRSPSLQAEASGRADRGPLNYA